MSYFYPFAKKKGQTESYVISKFVTDSYRAL
jgi:hypothetical protein